MDLARKNACHVQWRNYSYLCRKRHLFGIMRRTIDDAVDERNRQITFNESRAVLAHGFAFGSFRLQKSQYTRKYDVRWPYALKVH